jgi:cystathionine gamma-lyase/cystathionine gamma-lyase/homocysteine desulfhydrase
MQSHQDSTSLLAKWLKSLPQITRVYQPHVDGRQLTGYGGILFCDLRQDLVERYTEFSQALRLFDTGTAMACVTSMVAQPYSGSHASMSADEKAEMGLGKELIRLCFVLENIEDLKRDIQNALEKIDTTQIEHRLPQEVSSVSE